MDVEFEGPYQSSSGFGGTKRRYTSEARGRTVRRRLFERKGPLSYRKVGKVSAKPYGTFKRSRSGRRSSVKLSAKYGKRSSGFRDFRKRMRMKKASKVPGWAQGKIGRYLSRKVVIRDSNQFNINRMGDAQQNLQEYYMCWAATALDLDAWLSDAYNGGTAISSVPRYFELFVESVKKYLQLTNNGSQPADVDTWIVTPRRPYNGNTAAIDGLAPTLISDTTPTESGTTAFTYNNVGHEPYMSSHFVDAFKIKKYKSVRLVPGQTAKFLVAGSGGLYSKVKYGVAATGGMNDHHTLLRGLSRYGILVRVKGVLVHDESKVPTVGTVMSNTLLNVATGGFNLDCMWIRHAKWRAPIRALSDNVEPGIMWKGYDSYGLSFMNQANESRYGITVSDQKTEA